MVKSLGQTDAARRLLIGCVRLPTTFSKEDTVFNVGRTIDEVVRTPQGLKFASRLVVYDSEMIPNSLIYPI